MKQFFYFFFAFWLIFHFKGLCQLDITKYTSDDLFSPKPVITQEYLEQKSKDQVAESINTQIDVFVQEGMDFWENGEYDDAVDHFEQMALEYDVPVFYYYMGLINYEQEKYEDASDNLNIVLEKDPLFMEAKYMLGIIALDQDEDKEAKEIFKLLIGIQGKRI